MNKILQEMVGSLKEAEEQLEFAVDNAQGEDRKMVKACLNRVTRAIAKGERFLAKEKLSVKTS